MKNDKNYFVIPQIIPKGMRFIEDFRDKKKFKNSDFWIIGSDSNLDFYPDDFFKDKFTIAINASCIAFPKSTFFSIGGKDTIERMFKLYPNCLGKTILLLEHIGVEQIGRWENWGLRPIYMKPENKYLAESVPDYESTIKHIFDNGSCAFVLTRTTVHYAVFAAVILDARKIVLVGCAHGVGMNRAYAYKRGMGSFIGEDVEKKSWNLYYGSQGNEIAKLRRDTIGLARIFGKYGIEIIRHRYDEDKQDFVFEEIKNT